MPNKLAMAGFVVGIAVAVHAQESEIKSVAAKDALVRYQHAIAEADADWARSVRAALISAIDDLKKARDAAKKSVNLEDANAIDAQIRLLTNRLAALEFQPFATIVVANRDWQRSRVLKPGRYRITAKGSWSNSPNGALYGPEGRGGAGGVGRLQGRVGELAFDIGSAAEIEIQDEGALELRMNDQGFDGNRGSVEVTIERIGQTPRPEVPDRDEPGRGAAGGDLLPPLKPGVLSWPTMPYSSFMQGHPDEARRKEFWEQFVVVERQAKNFARNQNEWKPLRTVVIGTSGAKWSSSGRIQLGANTAPGTMFHEIFHNTFDGSEFQAGQDNGWSEAFSDAFRYMMEKAVLPEPRTSWFVKVDRFTGMTYDQVMARSGDKSFDRKYLYPASLIIRESQKDPKEFYDLWFKLKDLRRQRKTDILSAYFRYDMKNGRPMDN